MEEIFKRVGLVIFLIIWVQMQLNTCIAKQCCKISSPGYHQHTEQSYQQAWQKKYGGVLEYKNDDSTRVDCLTNTHAIEFDFANKWAEAVGQALYYQYKTGKRAKVILILEHPQSQMIYYNRVKALSKVHNFDVEYVTTDILELDCHNHCKNPRCKCHKK